MNTSFLQRAFLIGCAIVALFLALFFAESWLVKKGSHSATEEAIFFKLKRDKEGHDFLRFNLVDPGAAPPGLKSEVLYGYEIMLDTHKVLPNNVNNLLSCTNCHFAGGNSTGGRNGGIPLAGVAAAYPDFNPRSNTVIDLSQRIQSCFERSMNGKQIPYDSKEMIALVSYFQWISKNFPIYANVPWLGLKIVKPESEPNIVNGKALYTTHCAGCHQENGSGTSDDSSLRIPPLWGDQSFNDGAGMNKLHFLGSFIFWNMPYMQADLSEQQAFDIAGYILKQPRAKFKKSK